MQLADSVSVAKIKIIAHNRARRTLIWRSCAFNRGPMTMPVLDGPMTMPVLDGVKPMAITLPICGTSQSSFWKRKKKHILLDSVETNLNIWRVRWPSPRQVRVRVQIPTSPRQVRDDRKTVPDSSTTALIVGLLESMFIYCICTQYLVRALFALITASIRRGMELISLWHCWGGMEVQVSLTVAFSSSAFFGLLFLIFLLTIPNRWGSGLVSLLASQAHQHHGHLTNIWCFWQCGQVLNPKTCFHLKRGLWTTGQQSSPFSP